MHWLALRKEDFMTHRFCEARCDNPTPSSAMLGWVRPWPPLEKGNVAQRPDREGELGAGSEEIEVGMQSSGDGTLPQRSVPSPSAAPTLRAGHR